MPTSTFTFNFKPNISLQVGDVLYYAPTTSTGSFSTSSQESVVRVGKITALSFTAGGSSFTVDAEVDNSFGIDTSNLPYFFFGKENTVNTGSLIGYFSRVKFTNNSTEKGDNKGEMFSASCEAYESSK